MCKIHYKDLKECGCRCNICGHDAHRPGLCNSFLKDKAIWCKCQFGESREKYYYSTPCTVCGMSIAAGKVRCVLNNKHYHVGCFENDYRNNTVSITTPGTPRNYFNEAMALIQAMHDKKVHDYARSDNEFSNFEASADFAGVSVQDSFNILIGTKQARLLELTKNTKEPKNESILDTYLDRAVYAIIAYAYELKRQENDKSIS